MVLHTTALQSGTWYKLTCQPEQGPMSKTMPIVPGSRRISIDNICAFCRNFCAYTVKWNHIRKERISSIDPQYNSKKTQIHLKHMYVCMSAHKQFQYGPTESHAHKPSQSKVEGKYYRPTRTAKSKTIQLLCYGVIQTSMATRQPAQGTQAAQKI